MKILKKISLVYILQIFAVVLLFGYAVASPVNKTKEAVTDGIEPSGFSKQSLIRTDKDSVLTGNINALWKVYTANSW